MFVRTCIEYLHRITARFIDANWNDPIRKGARVNSLHRILVVDDEPANVRLLDGILRSLNYEAVGARSGHEALEKLQCPVDLILLDALMPEMDGFEVVRRVRRDNVYGDTPIIMVTVLSDREDRIRALEAGADDFITKPFDKFELKARVASLLSLKRARDAVKACLLERERIIFDMHHRVINSLTLLVSLLSVQAQRLENESWKGMLYEAEVRLRCMTIVHQTLYHSGSVSKLSARQYLSALLLELGDYFGGARKRIRAKLHMIDDCDMPADTALTLGMVVVEFLGYTVKNAASQHGSGAILVSLRAVEDELELVMAHEGLELTAGSRLADPESLERQLMNRLVQVIKGDLTVDEKEDGTTIILRFKK